MTGQQVAWLIGLSGAVSLAWLGGWFAGFSAALRQERKFGPMPKTDDQP